MTGHVTAEGAGLGGRISAGSRPGPRRGSHDLAEHRALREGTLAGINKLGTLCFHAIVFQISQNLPIY